MILLMIIIRMYLNLDTVKSKTFWLIPTKNTLAIKCSSQKLEKARMKKKWQLSLCSVIANGNKILIITIQATEHQITVRAIKKLTFRTIVRS